MSGYDHSFKYLKSCHGRRDSACVPQRCVSGRLQFSVQTAFLAVGVVLVCWVALGGVRSPSQEVCKQRPGSEGCGSTSGLGNLESWYRKGSRPTSWDEEKHQWEGVHVPLAFWWGQGTGELLAGGCRELKGSHSSTGLASFGHLASQGGGQDGAVTRSVRASGVGGGQEDSAEGPKRKGSVSRDQPVLGQDSPGWES